MASKKKVLLMGRGGSGKTSMRSIIFANYIARDTKALPATIEVEQSKVQFLGNLTLNLWDCGGQQTFMENYFASQKENIFRNVGVLIYVLDVESRDAQKDLENFQSCCEALLQFSRDARVFCLVHKMDLIPEETSDQVFSAKEAELTAAAKTMPITCFRTSIWDETLYLAWSSIVYSLIPNVESLEQQLTRFCSICEADEIVLFERSTFLVISHASRAPHADAHRFEKISNIIKQFKLSCGKLGSTFNSFEVRNSRFTAFVDELTPDTFVMVTISDPVIQSTTININIKGAKRHFENFFESTANQGGNE